MAKIKDYGYKHFTSAHDWRVEAFQRGHARITVPVIFVLGHPADYKNYKVVEFDLAVNVDGLFGYWDEQSKIGMLTNMAHKDLNAVVHLHTGEQLVEGAVNYEL